MKPTPACTGIQDFLKLLAEEDELCRISSHVSCELEIAHIVSETSRNQGPALLFENTDGSIPVLANSLGSLKRICIALGVEELNQAADRTIKMLTGNNRASDSSDYTKPVTSPQFHETVFEGDRIDLSSLPVPRCWPGDAGPAISLPVVFTRAPEDGTPNAGMYRVQILDRKTACMHWYPGTGGALHFEQACRMGIPLDVAVAIGTEPAVTLSACTPLPADLYEIEFAASLADRKIEMASCLHSNLEVPASSQIVLEGICVPGETHFEGPFGTHTGYYSRRERFPVFHVKSISMRSDAIFSTTVPGPPPQEDCFMAKAIERLFLPALKQKFPELVDINFPLEGIFGRMVFVSMHKQHPGHPEQLMQALWNMGRGMFSRMIWVFDHDVNIQDISEVLWKMANCINPAQDIVLAPGPTDALDPHSSICGRACRLGLDCTEKWPEERDGMPWPERIAPDKRTITKTAGIIEQILGKARQKS